MKAQPQSYPPGHWLRDDNPETVLAASRRQQSLAYSQMKNTLLWELLGEARGLRFLDYGCGAGFFAVEAVKCGASRVVGVDVQAPALAAARLLAQRENADSGCQFVQGESMDALNAGSVFDRILLRDVIEHVADDGQLLAQAVRHLAPAGRLVLATQNACSLNYVLERAARRVFLGQQTWLGWDPTHLRFYTPRRLRRLMRGAGLRPVAWRSAYLVPHKIPLPARCRRQFLRLEFLVGLDRIAGRIFPFNRLGWSLMLGAER